MTEQQFLEIASNCTIYYKPPKKKYGDNNLKIRTGKNLKDISLDDYILNKWCSGGIGGGNYGDCNNYYSIEAEPEPSFNSLDFILDAVKPNLTYKEYRDLINSGLIKYDSRTKNDYYGNESIYSIKKIMLRNLFEKLKEII